mgnify:CR=1 FL=1
MRVTVIIVNYRAANLAVEALRSVAAQRSSCPGLRAIVVDNASPDNSAEQLAANLSTSEFNEWATFLPLAFNGGFGWGNNQALIHALNGTEPPDAVLLLNPDAQLEPGSMDALVAALEQDEKLGAVGAQLVNTDGSLAGSAFRFPSILREWSRGHGVGPINRLLGIRPILVPYETEGPVDWVTGACVLIRTETLRQVGLFDTGFFLYFEEVELMHRMGKAGWTICHAPSGRVVHIAGASTGVVDGKSAGMACPPDYVFQSRRRYFALTGGRTAAFAASIAWMVGDAMRRLLGLVSASARSRAPAAEWATVWRLGLRPSTADATPHIARWTDEPGEPPAWSIAR